MLNKETVDNAEESIRQAIAQLPDERRAKIFSESKKQIKDPDTYAALNYGLMAGLHHMYLGKYVRALAEIVIFILGVYLLVNEQGFAIGLAIVITITAIELYELFRAQIIVQDHNNQVLKAALEKHR
ncbi:MAG: hypothetical protein V2I33_07055 [Kangiellaceae bacterium]|jgi:TM2 domain-containing membrane protein YozV|nr:hypothetical protein [Kangiellaceae bacterium]